MHSHAAAAESSEPFFLDMGNKRYRKHAAGRRNALRASEAVRATDVMVNLARRRVQKSPVAWGLLNYLEREAAAIPALIPSR